MNLNSQNSIEGIFLSFLAIVLFCLFFNLFDTIIKFCMDFSNIKNKYPKLCPSINKHIKIIKIIKFCFIVFLTFLIWNYSIYIPISSDSIVLVTIFFLYESKTNNDKNTLNEVIKILIYSTMIYLLDYFIKDCEPKKKIFFNFPNSPDSFLHLSLLFTFFKAIFYTKIYTTAIKIIIHNVNLKQK